MADLQTEPPNPQTNISAAEFGQKVVQDLQAINEEVQLAIALAVIMKG